MEIDRGVERRSGSSKTVLRRLCMAPRLASDKAFRGLPLDLDTLVEEVEIIDKSSLSSSVKASSFMVKNTENNLQNLATKTTSMMAKITKVPDITEVSCIVASLLLCKVMGTTISNVYTSRRSSTAAVLMVA